MFGVVAGLAVVVGMQTILIWFLIRMLGTGIGGLKPISELSSRPPEPHSEVALPTEFFQQLLLRSLRLDRSPTSAPDVDSPLLAEDERATLPSWQTDFPLPMEEALRREVAERRQIILDYQSQSETAPVWEAGWEEQYEGGVGQPQDPNPPVPNL